MSAMHPGVLAVVLAFLEMMIAPYVSSSTVE
jgi:hypothetical protein